MPSPSHLDGMMLVSPVLRLAILTETDPPRTSTQIAEHMSCLGTLMAGMDRAVETVRMKLEFGPCEQIRMTS